MIRILGADDVEAFKRIRLEALRLEPSAFASSFDEWAKLPDDEWRRRLLADPVFLAFDGNEPVAIMGLLRQRAGKMAHRATMSGCSEPIKRRYACHVVSYLLRFRAAGRSRSMPQIR